MPRGARHAAVLTLAAIALLAGCGHDGSESEASSDSETPANPSAPASPTESEPPEMPTEDPMPEGGPLAAAIADLSRDTGIDPDDIQVVLNEPITWRDGSLGCPKLGMMYTQALVDGYRIVLRAGGDEVAYHGSNGRPPFRCDHPDPNGSIRA